MHPAVSPTITSHVHHHPEPGQPRALAISQHGLQSIPPPREGAGIPPSSPSSLILQPLSPSLPLFCLPRLPPSPSNLAQWHHHPACHGVSTWCDLAPSPPSAPRPRPSSGLLISFDHSFQHTPASPQLQARLHLSREDALSPPSPRPGTPRRRCPHPTPSPLGGPGSFWMGGGTTPRRGLPQADGAAQPNNPESSFRERLKLMPQELHLSV